MLKIGLVITGTEWGGKQIIIIDGSALNAGHNRICFQYK